MAHERLLFIVLGPGPSHLKPITVEQLRNLARRRSDVEVQASTTGTRASKDMMVFDPRGIISGKLFFFYGRLQAKNPDDRTIEWMIELGNELNGRVIDSGGRTFRSVHEKYIHPDDVPTRAARARRLKIAKDKRIPYGHTVARWVIWAFFGALAAIAVALFGR
ncbi:MAG: hypothetical protein KIT85_21085 [Pseudolabrys sp.]|nr:hypothetical protein [Pseudolabrys sp.]